MSKNNKFVLLKKNQEIQNQSSQNLQKKIQNEHQSNYTHFPQITLGITLDQYFGSKFQVVEENNSYLFNESFSKNSIQDSIQTIQQFQDNKFQINELDEDQYSDNSNLKDQNCQKNPQTPEFENIIQDSYCAEIQKNIINKYKKSKKLSLHIQNQQMTEVQKIQHQQKFKQQNMSLKKINIQDKLFEKINDDIKYIDFQLPKINKSQRDKKQFILKENTNKYYNRLKEKNNLILKNIASNHLLQIKAYI